MVEFGGWLMPVQYTGIVAEHRQVRESAGAFDLSHMGRLQVRGALAGEFLQLAATNDVLRLVPMQVQYSLLCNRQGGVRDDILIYRLGPSEYLLVVNAANRLKVIGWLEEIEAELVGPRAAADVVIEDRTLETVMIGVQGPGSRDVLQPMAGMPLDDLGYYRAANCSVMDAPALVSRTGYTGEDGFEVILPVEAGVRLWRRLGEVAESGAVALAGLGARDTLRLEAGMVLYGHELDEDINPMEAGLSRFVHLEKPRFVGREALKEVADSGPARLLVGLEIADGAIARQGTPVEAEGVEVGQITSGGYSPTLDRSIAMALVRSDVAHRRPPLAAVIRERAHEARIVELPFFHRRRRKQEEQK